MEDLKVKGPLDLIAAGREGEAKDYLTSRTVRIKNASAMESPCIAITRGGDVVYVKGRKSAKGKKFSPVTTVTNRQGADYGVRSGKAAGLAMNKAEWHFDLIHLLPQNMYPFLYSAMAQAGAKYYRDKDYPHGKPMLTPEHLPTIGQVMSTLKDVEDGTYKYQGLSQMAEEFERTIATTIRRELIALNRLSLQKKAVLAELDDTSPIGRFIRQENEKADGKTGLTTPQKEGPKVIKTKPKAEPKSEHAIPVVLPKYEMPEVQVNSGGTSAFTRSVVATVTNGSVNGNIVSVTPTKDGKAVRMVIGAYNSAMLEDRSRWTQVDLDALIEVLQDIRSAIE